MTRRKVTRSQKFQQLQKGKPYLFTLVETQAAEEALGWDDSPIPYLFTATLVEAADPLHGRTVGTSFVGRDAAAYRRTVAALTELMDSVATRQADDGGVGIVWDFDFPAYGPDWYEEQLTRVALESGSCMVVSVLHKGKVDDNYDGAHLPDCPHRMVSYG